MARSGTVYTQQIIKTSEVKDDADLDKCQKVEGEERRAGREATQSIRGLSEVLLEEMQQCNLIMLSRLWTSDAVTLIWVNLERRKKKPQRNKVDSSISSFTSIFNSREFHQPKQEQKNLLCKCTT